MKNKVWAGFSASMVLALGMAAHMPVFALDASEGVKATVILNSDSSWNGAKLAYPEGQAEVTGMIIEVAPGAETGWHLHSVPSFAYLLEGNLEVTLKSGDTKSLTAGEALSEVVNTLHNGRNVGDVPVKLVVFYAGAAGSTLTEKP